MVANGHITEPIAKPMTNIKTTMVNASSPVACWSRLVLGVEGV